MIDVLFFVLFTLGLCCVAASYWFLYRVREILAARHPDVWRDISRKWFVHAEVGQFCWKSRTQELNDAELSRETRRFRIVHMTLFASCLTIVAMASLLPD